MRPPSRSTCIAILGVACALGVLPIRAPSAGAAAVSAPAGGRAIDRGPVYQEIALPWPNAAARNVLARFPDLEPMKVTPEVGVHYTARIDIVDSLRAAGLHPEVVWPDLGAHYRSQALGTGWGNFYTWDEVVAFLDSLHAAHPDLTTPRFSIGQSFEGRDLWAMKISDNPGIDENEPEVYFDAAHHAREVITPLVLANTMRWLTDGYGTDPEATFLVGEREFWFVPVVNPDGYVWNEVTDPSGGGLWRKNRRDNPSTCEGVDLNRNYGYQWGGAGASPDECDETYRGTAAWSEPETRAVRDFVSSRNFVTSDSYHSVAALVLFPWGYALAPPPDSALYARIGAARTTETGYVYGSCGPTLYLAAGGAFDWMYGDTVMKPRVFGFTTEVGGSGFWPEQSEIPALIAENLGSNIYLAEVAGPFVASTAAVVGGGNGNGRLDAGESATLTVTMKNFGVAASATGVQVQLVSTSPYVQVTQAVSSFGSLAPEASATNGATPFQVTVDPATPGGYPAVFDLVTTWGGGTVNHDALTLVVGSHPVLFADDGEAGNQGWTQDATHTATTGAWVLVDPNPTPYQPADDTTPAPGVKAWITAQNTAQSVDDVDGGISAVRSPVWNFGGSTHARMSLNWFFGQLQEGGDANDYFRVDLSNDGGASYPANLLLIGDVHRTPEWHSMVVDLEQHLPITNQMRLRFQASDRAPLSDVIEAGFDDLLVIDTGDGNQEPSAPANASPPASAVVSTAPSLVVANATDPEGQALTYGFTVYSDALLTTPVRSVSGVASGSGQTTWIVSPPLPDGTYWWRAWAADPEIRGAFSAATSFTATSATGIASSPADARFGVAPPAPNPFARGTVIRFTLPEAGPMRADVFDAGGRRVRSLYRGIMPAGQNALGWDGRDEGGQDAAPGLYFAILKSAGHQETVKLSLVR